MTEKRQVVVIQWRDACMLGGEQYSKDDKDIKLAYGFSAGILVREDKEMIALCLDKFDYGDKSYRTVQTYPKSAIKSIKRFNFKGK
jgi:hypothetical protein